MKRFSANKKGFTLVEEVVAVVLIGILILASAGMMIGAMRVLGRNVITLNAQEKGMAVMRQLEDHLKYADTISDSETAEYLACPYQTKLTVEESSGEYSLMADAYFDQYAGNGTPATGTNVLCHLGGFETKYTVKLMAADPTAGTPEQAEVYVSVFRNGTQYYAERRNIELKNDPVLSGAEIKEDQIMYVGSME